MQFQVRGTRVVGALVADRHGGGEGTVDSRACRSVDGGDDEVRLVSYADAAAHKGVVLLAKLLDGVVRIDDGAQVDGLAVRAGRDVGRPSHLPCEAVPDVQGRDAHVAHGRLTPCERSSLPAPIWKHQVGFGGQIHLRHRGPGGIGALVADGQGGREEGAVAHAGGTIDGSDHQVRTVAQAHEVSDEGVVVFAEFIVLRVWVDDGSKIERLVDVLRGEAHRGSKGGDRPALARIQRLHLVHPNGERRMRVGVVRRAP